MKINRATSLSIIDVKRQSNFVGMYIHLRLNSIVLVFNMYYIIHNYIIKLKTYHYYI